jgi:D-glycerate 3-kinase
MNQPCSHWQLEADYPIWPTVIAWGQGQPPSPEVRSHLINWELAHSRQPWQVFPDTVAITLENRAALLQAVLPDLTHQLPALLGKKNSRSTDSRSTDSRPADDSTNGPTSQPARWMDWIVPMWRLWLPLAQQLDRQQKALGAPFIQGILGGQGTGKTTLTHVLQLILKHLGHETVGLSIDDLYLTYAARQSLQQQDPRFIWRGPPGTHDLDLGIRTLDQFKKAAPQTLVRVPRFDKSLFQGQGDRIQPLIQTAPTIVLFEGWLVGAQPIADAVFDSAVFDSAVFDSAEGSLSLATPATPVNLPTPILTTADRAFARDSNRRLHAYLPLWRFLDSLIVLQPQDYRLSQRWRQEAEHSMKAQGKPGLCDSEIIDFVTYFWKALHPELFITPLTQSPTTALVVEITAQHTIGELYSPAFGHDGRNSNA